MKFEEADMEDLEQINLFLKEINLFQLDEFSFCQSYRKIYVLKENNTVVAFICFIVLSFEIELEAIYVNPSVRRKRIGFELIKKMVEDAGLCACESIFLEVRASNEAAFNLYRKYQFIEINRRKNYYGKEDGIVMKKELR